MTGSGQVWSDLPSFAVDGVALHTLLLFKKDFPVLRVTNNFKTVKIGEEIGHLVPQELRACNSHGFHDPGHGDGVIPHVGSHLIDVVRLLDLPKIGADLSANTPDGVALGALLLKEPFPNSGISCRGKSCSVWSRLRCRVLLCRGGQCSPKDDREGQSSPDTSHPGNKRPGSIVLLGWGSCYSVHGV